MPPVILNRLKAKAEELLAEEQADFRPDRRAVEQIFNRRVIMFNNFIYFKKAFDRGWHAGLWQVLRSFNVEEGQL